jgi:hypothetical protein
LNEDSNMAIRKRGQAPLRLGAIPFFGKSE